MHLPWRNNSITEDRSLSGENFKDLSDDDAKREKRICFKILPCFNVKDLEILQQYNQLFDKCTKEELEEFLKKNKELPLFINILSSCCWANSSIEKNVKSEAEKIIIRLFLLIDIKNIVQNANYDIVESSIVFAEILNNTTEEGKKLLIKKENLCQFKKIYDNLPEDTEDTKNRKLLKETFIDKIENMVTKTK